MRYLVGNNENLVKYNGEIDGTGGQDNGLYSLEFDVKAQEQQASRDDSIFPQPESISIDLDG
jgi:hypothetical protein